MSARAAGAFRVAGLALALGAAAQAQQPAPAVPPPFEPLRVTEDARVVEVALWGRSYRFAAGPLPSEIRSQGVALVAAPPRFRAAGRFGERDVAWGPPTLVEAGPAVVRLRSRGALPGFTLAAETRVDQRGPRLLGGDAEPRRQAVPQRDDDALGRARRRRQHGQAEHEHDPGAAEPSHEPQCNMRCGWFTSATSSCGSGARPAP